MPQNTFRIYIVALLTLFASLLPGWSAAQGGGAGEYQVKAAMLYNLTKFVDRPNEPAGSDPTSFTACVIGRNPFGSSLEALNGKPVKGQKMHVSYLSGAEEIGTCQLLFVSSSEKRNLAAIIAAANRRSVLTVSDLDRFAASGGMIGFVEVEGKIRLEVNLDATQNANLKISSQLLTLARIVKGGE